LPVGLTNNFYGRQVIHDPADNGRNVPLNRTRQVGAALAILLLTFYRDLGFKGRGQHSGRRTFITKAAKRCIEGLAACGTFSSLPGMKSFHDPALHRGSSDAAFSRQIYSPT
jgi:hypothetical protein